MVGVSVGRVRGVLVVDAAFALCAGMSRFSSVRARLDGSSFGRASRGATYAQVVSPQLGICDIYVDFGEALRVVHAGSKVSLVSCFTAHGFSSSHALLF